MNNRKYDDDVIKMSLLKARRAFINSERLIRQINEIVYSEIIKKMLVAQHLLATIQTYGIEIVPYKTRADISISVHHFLDEVDKGVFLHLYVPNGRYQEDQLASFLRLFESYLQRVEKLPFFIDTRKTLHGQVYEFKGIDNNLNLSDMKIAFTRFEDFMGLCQNDLSSAEALLLRSEINPTEANRLLTKFIKEYRRLLLDIEHERKRKLLEIELRLENDIFELANAPDLELLQPVQPTTLLSLSSGFDPINITISNSSVSINSGTQSFIEQAIYGDIQYTHQDKELIQFFEKYAERLERVQLRSCLDELKDTSLPENERKNAMQKIAGFLYNKVVPAVGPSVLQLLTAYLQKILIGS